MAAPAASEHPRHRLRHALPALLGVALFAVALAVLDRELAQYRLHDVRIALARIPGRRLATAGMLTVLSYLVLTAYDTLALRYVGAALSYARVAFASFVGYVFSHNVGLSVLGGGAVRLRLYGGWGLSATDVARVLAFTASTFWLGFLALLGTALATQAPALGHGLHLAPALVRALGAVALAGVAAYLVWTRLRRTPVTVGSWELAIPGPRLALAQVGVSTLDWMLAASVLWVLLPDAVRPVYPAFLGVFLLAQVVAVASHVPGGLGVFETAIVLLLPHARRDTMLGALVAYRVIYYLVPFVVAVTLLAAYEVSSRRGTLPRVLVSRLSAIVPPMLAALMFLGAVVLLVSGATPALRGRIDWLSAIVPLPVLELSHFVGSLVGLGLLLVARGLQQRLDVAWVVSAILLLVGSVASLLKGGDWEEALVLLTMLAVLLPCRRHFDRRTALLEEPFTAGWLFAIALTLVGTAGLVLIAHQDVEYSHELWWQFEISADAPRSLRALAATLVACAAFGGVRLLRPKVPEPVLPSPADLDRALAVIRAADRADAHLALLGDKQLLFSDAGNAFLMYGVEGRSFVAMGDPVGPPDEARELAWRFHELSDRHGGWTVFYEVTPDLLPLYLDLGLNLLKLGEEARVPLRDFSLEGGERKALRGVHRKVGRECALSILEPAAVPAVLDELDAVSQAWLGEKRTREKRFSLGRFDRAYLARTPVAVVRREGRAVAFANLWLAAPGTEVSVDLMRHVPDAPSGLMDFLFVELLLWGRAQGFGWFGFGMAPFSGLEDRALAPLWHRLGAFLFEHGESFYHFQGLRQYKEKFRPVWRPRYLASPGGLALPTVLTNVAALVSGGLTGVVAR